MSNARSERGFAFYLRRVYLPHDECYATEGLGGAALWLPPEKWHLGPLAQLRLAPGMLAAMGPRLPQVLRAISTIESSTFFFLSKRYHWDAFPLTCDWTGASSAKRLVFGTGCPEADFDGGAMSASMS